MNMEAQIKHQPLENLEKPIRKMVEVDIENEVNDLTEKCQKWLEKCSDDDNDSVCSETNSSSMFSDTTENSAMDSGFVFENNDVVVTDQIIRARDSKNAPLIIRESNKPKYDNVNIYKSKKVHVGDVTYINGPVIISNNNSAYNDRKISEPYNDPGWDAVNIVNRINWLAQPALGEKEHLDYPAKYVIICHTATEEGFTQADNTLLVRLIQTFHIESRKWKDIAYNFLIGSDGLAYEGRGWGLVGSHTRNYNSKAVGIAFIGCFLNHLPPAKSIKKAKDLIEFGVKRGSIAEDYKLLAHCQCSSIESPGKKLFEEIRTWEHWDGTVSVPKSTLRNKIEDNTTDEDCSSLNLP